MRISVAQMNMKLGDCQYNFAHAEELIRKAAKGEPDVIMLPETWNNGFFPKQDLAASCDKDAAAVKRLMSKLAAELNVNIVAGSVSNIRENGIFNTALIFDRKGECIAHYDKTHLFTLGDEHHYYVPGDRLCTFELDGVKCGLIICYDIRFPELSRSLALDGIKILFIPAQWPTPRTNHWDTLVAARAIENQLFVSACNSCAADTNMAGSSRIVDPYGNVLASAGREETIISAELDFSLIDEVRAKLNVYRDRRSELYRLG